MGAAHGTKRDISILFFFFLFKLAGQDMPLTGVQFNLTDPDGFRGDFNHFIVTDKMDGLLQSHGFDRGTDGGLVLA